MTWKSRIAGALVKTTGTLFTITVSKIMTASATCKHTALKMHCSHYELLLTTRDGIMPLTGRPAGWRWLCSSRSVTYKFWDDDVLLVLVPGTTCCLVHTALSVYQRVIGVFNSGASEAGDSQPSTAAEATAQFCPVVSTSHPKWQRSVNPLSTLTILIGVCVWIYIP